MKPMINKQLSKKQSYLFQIEKNIKNTCFILLQLVPFLYII